MLRDWEAAEAAGEVPEPELQYKDEEGGGRILIWLPQDTLPLDVLLGARPQVSSTAMQAVSLVAGTGSL